MPGIAGIVSRLPRDKELVRLETMVQSMMHEPFYRSTTYIDSDHGFYLAGVSLNGSFSDCLPILNEKEDFVMLFAGECYPDIDVFSNLRSRGHEFTSNNASYLIHQFEEFGEKALADLNGWFSGILLDLSEGTAMLFNDRFGMQRIYYYENKDSFYFSSEAKALLKLMPSLRSVDMTAIGEYLNYNCVLANRTFFSNIFLLPAGSKWTFSRGEIKKEQYFNPSSWENQPYLDKNDFLEQVCDTFKAIVPRYFRHGKAGMALTGGLDTRSILAAIHSKPGQLPCYTYGGMYRDSLDVRIARRVAEACNQKHVVLRLGKGYLSDFSSQVERAIYISDGLANVTIADEVYMNKLSREIAPVKMTGKFGSQVLRGLAGLRERIPDLRLIDNDFEKYIAASKETFSYLSMVHPLSFFLFREIPWFWSGFTVAELSQLTVRSPYLDNEFIRVLYKAPPEFLKGYEFHFHLIQRTMPKLLDIHTDKGMGGEYGPVVSKFVKLYYRLLGTADKVYTWDHIPYFMTHWVARIDHLVAFLHMDALVKGHAFFRHYRTWFRDELSQYVKDMVLDSRTLQRPYWNDDFLKNIVNDHTNGRRNYLSEIRKVLTVELIHRILIEDI